MKRNATLILIFTLVVTLFAACAPKTVSVMTIGGTEISVEEYNYNYYAQIQSFYAQYSSYLSYFGLDTTKPLKDQTCTIAETEQTWAQFFMDQTEEMLKQIFFFYNAAVAEQMELSEESRLQLDAFILSATEAAQKAGKTLEDFLAETYGEGVTEAKYREFLGRRLLATQYCDMKLGGIVYSDAEFDAYYQENKASIDRITFRVYTLTESFLPADTDASTEDEVDAAVKAMAETFANELTTEEEFVKRAVAYAPEKDRETYASDSATLARNIAGSDLADSDMKVWLFDAARKAGDVAVHQTSEATYTVCFFLSRGRDENPLASMRHILLSVTTEKDGSSDDAVVAAEIQTLFEEWKKAGCTEESFIALASEHTDDPGSKETGGLYENFSRGTMVAPIDDWLYAEGREKGDYEVIKTDFGYHLVWFTGYGEIGWKNECLPGLESADYEELLSGLEEQNPIVYSENYQDLVGNAY